MEEIKTGYLVELKSGSPTMTVEGFINDMALCTFFCIEKQEFVKTKLSPPSLIIVEKA